MPMRWTSTPPTLASCRAEPIMTPVGVCVIGMPPNAEEIGQKRRSGGRLARALPSDRDIRSPELCRLESHHHELAPSSEPHSSPCEETEMAPSHPVETKKFFSIDEANKALPLVKVIVGDIGRQWKVVSDLRGPRSALLLPQR